MKKCSGLNQERNLHRCQNSSKLICGWILMRETTADALYHWGRVIMDYKHIFDSPSDVNWWTVEFFYSDGTHLLQSIHWCWDTDEETHSAGLNKWTVDYCDVFILTAPIHCRVSIDAETLMKKHTQLVLTNELWIIVMFLFWRHPFTAVHPLMLRHWWRNTLSWCFGGFKWMDEVNLIHRKSH